MLHFELYPFLKITVCLQMSVEEVRAKASPKGSGMICSEQESLIFQEGRSLVLGDLALQRECILSLHKSFSTPELNVGSNRSHNFAQAQRGNLSSPQTSTCLEGKGNSHVSC